LILLGVALLFLGPKRLPAAGRALGQGLKEFKDSIGGHDEERQLAETTPAEHEPTAS
jgi:sec-independent protein translocase protein TatA